MNRVTASGMARTLACPVSRHLPQVQTSTVYSQRGVVAHRYLLQDVPELGVALALNKVPPEFVEWCAAIDVAAMPKAGEWAAEVAFEYDVHGGGCVELARGLPRGEAYKRALFVDSVLGQADLVGLEADGTVAVLDLKSGFADKGDAERDAQLLTYAVMARAAYSKPGAGARVGFIYLRDDVPTWRLMDVSPQQLDAHAHAMRTAAVAPKSDEAAEGAHCGRCPSFAHCPAKVSLARAIGASDAAELMGPLTPETAAKVVLRLDAFQAVLASVETRLREYVLTLPEKRVALGDGRTWGRVTLEYFTVTDVPKAWAQLEKAYGAEVADAAVAETITGGNLEEAMRLWKERTPGATLKAAKEGARELLLKTGAATMRPLEQWRTSKEKKP